LLPPDNDPGETGERTYLHSHITASFDYAIKMLLEEDGLVVPSEDLKEYFLDYLTS